jgi:ferredoxin
MNKFLKKLDPRSAKYVFAVGTRMGTLCLANIPIEEVLERKGKRLDAYFILNMPNNSPTGLVPAKGNQKWADRNTEEKVQALDTAVRDRLDVIQSVITNREQNPDDDSPRLGPLLKRPLARLMAWAQGSRSGMEIPYCVDSSCTGCGTCEMVCPSQKITLADGKPVWQEEVQCYFCYACFNFCPTQSILVGERYTLKDGRYSHPGITAEDIAGQKEASPESSL